MNLDRYIDLIKSGEVVAFPTETVYGLGADAWNPDAIAKVFKIKGRPSDNPLIVHISDEAQIEDFALDIPDHAHRLIKAFWPGPLTLVLNKKPEVLDAVTAGLNTVALRMPEHPLALSLIKESGALVAPSANKSGSPSPTKAAHVFADFGDDFPVIDGEATRIGLESTVVDLTESFPAILRPGSISRKQIEDVLDTFVEESFFHHIEKPRSPGQKYSHYKPKAEVRWLSDDETMHNSKALYLVQSSSVESKNIIVYHNDLTLMARELYDRFREADIEGFTSVVIERFERKSPIAEALLNRISKAISN